MEKIYRLTQLADTLSQQPVLSLLCGVETAEQLTAALVKAQILVEVKDVWLSSKEAAEVYGVPVETLKHWRKNGSDTLYTGHKLGERLYRYSLIEIERCIRGEYRSKPSLNGGVAYD